MLEQDNEFKMHDQIKQKMKIDTKLKVDNYSKYVKEMHKPTISAKNKLSIDEGKRGFGLGHGLNTS